MEKNYEELWQNLKCKAQEKVKNAINIEMRQIYLEFLSLMQLLEEFD